jgi:argininosuccinate lyase
MDAVADRDACVEFASAAATLLMHLSRYCEEIVLWASAEFAFVAVDQSCSTGSSVMPQKRNPDPAELIRGKSGRAYGDLVALLVMQKGLPLAYDRDLQEDKSLIFDSGDTAFSCALAFARLVRALEPRTERMREAAEDGCLWAADAAEFLVLRGVPFRTAYAAGRRLVEARAAAAGPAKLGRSPAVGAVIADLGSEGLAALHPSWRGVDHGELSRYLSLEACIARRDLVGGPAPARTKAEIERLKAFVDGKRAALK